MGTSGHRNGYKIFSINTTVRNPIRNYDFLRLLQKYDGNVKDDTWLTNYYYDLYREGIYTSEKVSSSIKQKWEQKELLTVSDIQQLVKDNPQATKIPGRVMTQLRALKDQQLIRFYETGNRNKFKIVISDFGKELLKNPGNAQNIYTKIMLGMHANSPCRTSILNESRPFLNTIFVINEVNKRWAELGHEAKGILTYEFSTFVLSMKDCDYRSASDNIINYRLKNGLNCVYSDLKKYLDSIGIIALSEDTLTKDYPDEVFRKFEITGLLIRHGAFSHIYINFSDYNKEKIKFILKEFNQYYFHKFKNENEYFEFGKNIMLPWETDMIVRQKIVDEKAKVLHITLDESMTLSQKEEYLDALFYNSALDKAIKKYDYDILNKELLILSGSLKENSKFDQFPEPLRLEYLLALYIGKTYGTKGLVSNIIYNENGVPLHCASSGKCDISYHHSDGTYIFEPTMIKSRNQLLNSETTNIVRHAKEETDKYNILHRVIMIAPHIHSDVVDFFKYKAVSEEAHIIPLTIEKTMNIIDKNRTIISLNVAYDEILNNLKMLSCFDFADKVNNYSFKKADIIA